jgi:hypothetical protein
MTESPEPADFLEWLDRSHREWICAKVHRKYPSFSQQDLEDVWAETRRDLFLRWPDKLYLGKGFRSLLRTIAFRRACDRFRRNKKHDNLFAAKAAEVQAKAKSEEQGGTNWWERLTPSERRELTYQTNEAFRLLSPDEWLVMSVYCEHYPKFRSPWKLLALLNEEFPEVRHKAWTPADVKRLLDHARMIVQSHLCRKGYKLDFGR